MWFAVVAILLLMSMNLRGIRESGTAFAIPTYAFIVGMFIMLGWGCSGSTCWAIRSARSRPVSMHAEHGDVLGSRWCSWSPGRSASGCAALTGVEAISNGVPARKPKSKNAATTLLMLGPSRWRC